MSGLGNLGGGFTSVSDINDLGQVVGYSTTTSGESHFFLYSSANGQMKDIDLGRPKGGPSMGEPAIIIFRRDAPTNGVPQIKTLQEN